MSLKIARVGTSNVANAALWGYAGTMFAIGIWGLFTGDLAAIWEPGPKDQMAREILAYLCAVTASVGGLALLSARTAPFGARLLFVYLLVWMLAFKVPYIFLAPTVEGSYQSCGENAVLVAGAWVLYVRLATAWDRRYVSHVVDAMGLRLARILYGLALVAFGLSHFAYLNLTAPLVPTWMPGPVFWAYFTGCTYLAAGAALTIGIYSEVAATLAAIQFGLITILVWGPIIAAGHVNAFHWQETVFSCALTAAAWVIADSFRQKLLLKTTAQ